MWNTALNLLGLSTQVTAVWSYISDGPYKTYEWNSTKLEFKHRTNKEITGLSYMTSLVIQAKNSLAIECYARSHTDAFRKTDRQG